MFRIGEILYSNNVHTYFYNYLLYGSGVIRIFQAYEYPKNIYIELYFERRDAKRSQPFYLNNNPIKIFL